MFAGLMPFQAWVDLRGVKGSDMAGEGGVLDFAEPVSISTQVHRHLRQAIIQGEFAPGQSLSEAEIGRLYAVSRQPVREAFIKLAEERMLEVVPQRGTRVRKISVSEVLDARFVREVIEIAVVRQVAAKADPSLVRSLRRLIVLQAAVTDQDRQSFLKLDEEFHHALAQAAGREYAWRVVEGVKAQMNRARFLTIDVASSMPFLIGQHTAVVDCIERGEPDAAAAAIKTHLQELVKTLPVIAEANPESFVP